MSTMVIGAGQTGKPLSNILRTTYRTILLDLDANDHDDINVDWMHICIPYSQHFTKIVSDYIAKFKPKRTVIHSTVKPGATASLNRDDVFYSPIQGRHGSMRADLLRYPRIVAGSGDLFPVLAYFQEAGFRIKTMTNTTVLETAKLFCTTYTALLIAWAQDMEKYCEVLGISREEALGITQHVEHLPRAIFYPGHIGGHCLMPNIEILLDVKESVLLRAIQALNYATPEDGVRYEAKEL